MSEFNIKRELFLNISQETAFDIFVNQFSTWWPSEYTWSQDKLVKIMIEPKINGRCYEEGPYELFVKPTTAGKAFIGDYIEGAPYPGAKLYLLISGDYWEDHEWLTQLIQITAAELPVSIPKKKTIRKSKTDR